METDATMTDRRSLPTNPFIARSGIDPKVFIGRDEEIRFFREDRLMNMLSGRCLHYVITGSWGVGKTILLRQMKLQAQQEGIWALQFSMRAFGKNEDSICFAQHVLGMAASELPIEPKPKKGKVVGAGGSVLGFGLQFSLSDPSVNAYKDSQVHLRDGLIEIYEHAVLNKAKGVILLLDDIQNLPPDGSFLTLLRNVITDPKIAGRLRLLVVISSIDSGWIPFLEMDHPIGRLFLPRHEIGKLSESEVSSLIRESLDKTGVVFEEDVSKAVFEITKGHVFEVQALCEALFDRQIQGKVTMESWDASLQHTLLSLADAQFRGMLKRASDQEQEALAVLARSKRGLGPSDVKAACPSIGNTAMILRRLVEKGLAESPSRGAFIISDRLFAEYVIRQRHEAT